MKFSWKINLIVAGFFISFLTDGIFYSFAVLFPGLLKDFKKGESDTAWVASLSRGFIQLIGLVVGPLTKQFGCTAVAIVGSLLASTALFLSAFATEILYLDFSYGILGGCAAGFCIHPAVIATTINFSKHRGLAVGLVTAGTGCGIFAFAPFMNVIVDAYNWQASLMICGGIILNVTILALFLRPFNPFRCCCKLVPGRDPSLQPVNPCRCCVKAKPSENITPEAAPEQQSFVERQLGEGQFGEVNLAKTLRRIGQFGEFPLAESQLGE
uniref:Major facilitator superfamily (MFS) profile domain-containing protein n=1 Tax=Strigamia maritima TaxID=126957 RepID=T1JNC2_STRMM